MAQPLGVLVIEGLLSSFVTLPCAPGAINDIIFNSRLFVKPSRYEYQETVRKPQKLLDSRLTLPLSMARATRRERGVSEESCLHLGKKIRKQSLLWDMDSHFRTSCQRSFYRL